MDSLIEAARQARRHVEALKGPAFDTLCDAVLQGELDFEDAARQALQAESEDAP